MAVFRRFLRTKKVGVFKQVDLYAEVCMFRGGARFTEVEERALEVEVARIEALGVDWQPTKDALREVILAIKLAGNDEQRAKQRKGIAQARAAGVSVGRPRKEIPKAFPQCMEMIATGELTRGTAAKMMGVSAETFRRWARAWEAEQEADAGRDGQL